MQEYYEHCTLCVNARRTYVKPMAAVHMMPETKHKSYRLCCGFVPIRVSAPKAHTWRKRA